MTTIFSDLHLREQSEDICFKVLDWIGEQATHDDRHIVFCGDWWHLRYQVNVKLLNRVHQVLTHWGEIGIELDLVPGNHDQVDIEGTNALEVFEAHNSVRVWTEPGVLESPSMGFVPYRKDATEQLEALQAVVEEKPLVIFSHFGVQNAVMNSSQKDKDGLSINKDWPELVLGHYHKAQIGPGWRYVGSPYQTSYGEAGNVCGCLRLSESKFEFCPIEVGAPKHHILKWDLSENDQPPLSPGEAGDNIRLDIKASSQAIAAGKLQEILKKHDLSDAQINVIPITVNRDHRFELLGGESLLEAANRFAAERLGNEKTDAPMAALKRWAAMN